MKKLALVLLLVTGLAAPALAGPIGSIGSFNYTRVGGYYTGNGGEFTLYNYGASLTNLNYSSSQETKNVGNVDPSFQTFCIETGETADSPSYFVVNSGAVLGGAGGTGTFDALSKGSAWLYSQFALGILNVAGGDYFSAALPARSTEAGRFQTAIWALEGEVAAPAAGANAYYDAALLNGGAADAPAGYLGVYVLNNFDTAAQRNAFVSTGATAGLRQDFLDYVVPDGGATLMLLGGALMGLGALRRKLRR